MRRNLQQSNCAKGKQTNKKKQKQGWVGWIWMEEAGRFMLRYNSPDTQHLLNEQVKASCAALTVAHCCAVAWESHISPSLVCSLSTPAQSYAVANHWDQVGLDVCIVCQLNCWESHVPTSVWLRSSRSNDYGCLSLTCCYLCRPEPPVLIFLSKQQKCDLQILTLEVMAFLVKHYF